MKAGVWRRLYVVYLILAVLAASIWATHEHNRHLQETSPFDGLGVRIMCVDIGPGMFDDQVEVSLFDRPRYMPDIGQRLSADDLRHLTSDQMAQAHMSPSERDRAIEELRIASVHCERAHRGLEPQYGIFLRTFGVLALLLSLAPLIIGFAIERSLHRFKKRSL